MRPAGFWVRLFASFLDGLLLLFPLVVLNVVLRFALSGSVGKLATLLALFPLGHAYSVLGHFWYGKTLGKHVLRIRVENRDGGPVGLLQSVLRSSVSIGLAFLMLAIQMVYTLSSGEDGPNSPGGLAVALAKQPSLPIFLATWFLLSFSWDFANLVSILVDKRKRAVHDFLAGTVVVVTEPVGASAEAQPTSF